MLAGRLDEAIPFLRRAARSCGRRRVPSATHVGESRAWSRARIERRARRVQGRHRTVGCLSTLNERSSSECSFGSPSIASSYIIQKPRQPAPCRPHWYCRRSILLLPLGHWYEGAVLALSLEQRAVHLESTYLMLPLRFSSSDPPRPPLRRSFYDRRSTVSPRVQDRLTAIWERAVTRQPSSGAALPVGRRGPIGQPAT